jgi:hypothetical protein
VRLWTPSPCLQLASTLLIAAGSAVGPVHPAFARPRQPPGQQAPGARVNGQPLFGAHDVMLLTIETDLRSVVRDRDSTKARWHPATLRYADESGSPLTLPVELKTRGHWRLDPDHCDFPQLRVSFPAEQPANSPFAGQDRLKLTTPCRPRRAKYEQYVLREYLVYRLYQLLTPRSFGVRLARITYLDANGRLEPRTMYSFFVEDHDRLAARHGARVIEVEGGSFDDLDSANAGLVSLFQYMVGGTDWSIFGLHNIRLLQDTLTGVVSGVPYDFDWTGIVDTEYAVPDARLGLSTVRQRLYRGPCRTEQEWAPIFQRFEAVRDSAYALYSGVPDLDPAYTRDVGKYLDAFYRVIRTPQLVRRELIAPCRERA